MSIYFMDLTPSEWIQDADYKRIVSVRGNCFAKSTSRICSSDSSLRAVKVKSAKVVCSTPYCEAS